MRLLLFAPYFWPHRGGMEKYAEETCARLVEKGCQVDVVTALLPNTKEKEQYRGMNIFRVPTWNILGGTFPIPKFSVWKRLAELKRNNYDAIITHTRFFPLSFVGALFAKKNKIPHLHIEHGTAHTGSKPFVFSINWFYDHTIGTLILRWASAVAGISQASCKFANHLCRSKTILLPNAIDTSFFHHQNIKNPFKTKVITFVGRLIEAKGVQDLLAATREMDVKVVIIGSGNYERKLKALAASNIVFLWEKDAAGIREVLSYTDIFVNPSYAEGLPTSVLEAGAMGLPVIATDVGGTGEIIDNGVNGFLIRPHDVVELRKKIVQLLDNSVQAKKFGIELQKKVCQEFDWKTTVQKLEKLLNKM